MTDLPQFTPRAAAVVLGLLASGASPTRASALSQGLRFDTRSALCEVRSGMLRVKGAVLIEVASGMVLVAPGPVLERLFDHCAHIVAVDIVERRLVDRNDAAASSVLSRPTLHS